MVIHKGEVGISPDKVKVILNEKPPTSKKGVQCFLGITNYHQRFIRDYTKITRPLHELQKIYHSCGKNLRLPHSRT
jgi:hypothetical protein